MARGTGPTGSGRQQQGSSGSRRTRSRKRVHRSTRRRPDKQEQRFLFDPYWDEVFAAYYDPTLGTCCRI